MLLKTFIVLIIIAAIALGGIAVYGHGDQLGLTVYRDFFAVSLPILGFGALIKYLCTCATCCNCKLKD